MGAHHPHGYQTIWAWPHILKEMSCVVRIKDLSPLMERAWKRRKVSDLMSVSEWRHGIEPLNWVNMPPYRMLSSKLVSRRFESFPHRRGAVTQVVRVTNQWTQNPFSEEKYIASIKMMTTRKGVRGISGVNVIACLWQREHQAPIV